MQDFEENYIKLHEVIGKLDMNLTQKAGKIQLDQLELKQDKKFISSKMLK